MSQDVAFTLAEYAASLRLRDLPPSAVAVTKQDILDTLSTAIAGSSSPGIGEMLGLVEEWGGAPQATIIVYGRQVPAHHAAWVNSAMAHAHDYDDTHDVAMLHCGVTVVPAALAAAELVGGARGDDLLAGITAGLDIICRLGMATTVGIVESGWIYTALLGTFGATAAAGRVMGLSPSEMVNALGIAYSQAAGNYQAVRDSALTKRMQPAFAAKAALVSAQLAKRGVRGAQNTFQGKDGFFRVYLQNRYDATAITDGLGTRFEHEELSFKPYPCCRPVHVAIDTALQARQKWNLLPERIRRVEVRVNIHCYEAACIPIEVRKAPRTEVEAQFSIPYTVAAALAHGRVGLADFTEAGLRREEVMDLAARVDGVIDEELERGWHARVCPVILRIETADGEMLEHRVNHPLGSKERPMSRADFSAKLADCISFSARPLPGDAAERLGSLVDVLESLPDVGALVRDRD